MNQDSTKVWCLFATEASRLFPNFYPLGLFRTEQQALTELERLPKDRHYQLFELPMDTFLGHFNKEGNLVSGLGVWPHKHFDFTEELT